MSYFLYYKDAIYVIKSKVLYLGQFLVDLDEIWYKSRATWPALTHQISSEKQQRYGTCSISQGRRGTSNGVSKMNLFMAGGHSFWPRKLIFGYVVAQCIYPKSYYYSLLIKSSVWSRQGPKDVQSVPKYRVRLYRSLRGHSVPMWLDQRFSKMCAFLFLERPKNSKKSFPHILQTMKYLWTT